MPTGEGERFGRYEIKQPLARGGMGEICLARDTVLDRIVVLKLLPQERAEHAELVDMFFEEARAIARCDHPNIVRVFDLGVEDDVPYMSLEWLRGWDMYALFVALTERAVHMPLRLLLPLFVEACRGLDAAHNATTADGTPLNLVHRDLSPRNLFVTETGQLKVLDFGIARIATRMFRTEVGVFKGTTAYASPEQILTLPVDRRSDIFSLGTLLHEFLGGQRLFFYGSVPKMVEAILHVPVLPPQRQGETLPVEVVAIAMRALQRQPERRYPTAAAMADALEQAIAVLPTEVGPSLASYLAELTAPVHAPSQEGSSFSAVFTDHPPAPTAAAESSPSLAEVSRPGTRIDAVADLHELPTRLLDAPDALALGAPLDALAHDPLNTSSPEAGPGFDVSADGASFNDQAPTTKMPAYDAKTLYLHRDAATPGDGRYRAPAPPDPSEAEATSRSWRQGSRTAVMVIGALLATAVLAGLWWWSG